MRNDPVSESHTWITLPLAKTGDAPRPKGLLNGPSIRIVETTPTTVRQGPGWPPVAFTVRKRRPMALVPAKCFCAKPALTIVTGCFESKSSSVNVRPASSRLKFQ